MPVLSNGGSNGHAMLPKPPNNRNISPISKAKKSNKQQSLLFLNSRAAILCLGSLVLMTIVVDTYFLWPRERPLWRGIRHFTGNRRPGFAEMLERPRLWRGTQLPAQQQPIAQKVHPNLPKLQPKNREFTEGPVAKFDFARAPILKVFQQAGIPPLNDTMVAMLPTWDQIVKVIGSHPVIGGLDTCDAYRQNVPAVERMLGSSGMFNTGTNLVTHLLKNNCKIPERVTLYGVNASREMHGMRWQVPWGKHSPAKYKEMHSTEKAKSINKEWIMPVVTIRHPYSWMHSMCKNGYTARWQHGRRGNNCPNLRPGGDWNEVTTKFAEGRIEYSDSLAHLWNDWYKYYLEDAKYPRLIVRLEDLVFHAQETTTAICTCVGGEMRKDRPFTYVLDSAKADSRGHDTSTGFIQAWIKYSRDMPSKGGFTKSDYEAAEEALNREYMEQFHYKHPPP